MPGGVRDDAGRRETDEEAAAWFARMRGPDREAHREAFERWRGADPANAEAYARALRLWDVSAALRETAVGRERALPGRPAPFWRLPVRRPMLAGLAALLILVFGSAAWLLTGAGHVAPAGQLARAERTQVGEIRQVRLAGGISITLDTDSAVEIGGAAGTPWIRLLRGRARFDGAEAVGVQLLVRAGAHTLSGQGATFDAALGPGGLQVHGLRGSVDVDRAAGVRVGTGQCFTEAGTGRGVAPAARGAEQWVSGMLSFDAVPLGEVLAQTNRYSVHRIRLGDRALAGLKVTGAFRPLPTDQLAASLATAFSLRVERLPGGDFVLRR